MTELIEEVPFLWASGRFTMKIAESQIDLPLYWFSNTSTCLYNNPVVENGDG